MSEFDYEMRTTESGTYEVLENKKVIGVFGYVLSAENFINKCLQQNGKEPWLLSFLKRLAICVMITPVLLLAYHKGLAEYTGWLWPEATLAQEVTTGVISLLAAFASGIFISLNWKSR